MKHEDTKQLGKEMLNTLASQGVKIDAEFNYSDLHTEYKTELAKMYLEEADDDLLAECLPGQGDLGGMLAPFLLGAASYRGRIIQACDALRLTAFERDDIIGSEAVFPKEFNSEYGVTPYTMARNNPAYFHRIVGEKITDYLQSYVENAIELELPKWLADRNENSRLIAELDNAEMFKLMHDIGDCAA